MIINYYNTSIITFLSNYNIDPAIYKPVHLFQLEVLCDQTESKVYRSTKQFNAIKLLTNVGNTIWCNYFSILYHLSLRFSVMYYLSLHWFSCCT